MMKLSRKGYLAPWSSRRENVGLMGTFLIFFMGLSGHSKLLVDQTRHLGQQLIQLVLVFLGLVAPIRPVSTQNHVLPINSLHQKISPAKSSMPVPSFSSLAPMIVPVMPESNEMFMHTTPFLRHRTYLFQGKATLHGQICRNASVLIRLSSGDQSVTQGTVTNPDGTYYVQVGIDASDKDPVDWTVHAYTTDFHQVEIVGRKIVQDGDDQGNTPIVVTAPVDFLASLPK